MVTLKTIHRFGARRGLLFFLFHPFRHAAARLGCAAEGGIITARGATVLKLGVGALLNTDHCQRGLAACACMGADQFRGPSAFRQDLSALHSLLDAGDPDGLALGTHSIAMLGLLWALGRIAYQSTFFTAINPLASGVWRPLPCPKSLSTRTFRGASPATAACSWALSANSQPLIAK